MKKALWIVVCLLATLAARGDLYLGNSDWTQPFTTDSRTLALWKMNETAGSTNLPDASGLGNHGYLMADTAFEELDPDVTWSASMAGFGNAAHTWWNSSSDQNRGPIQVDPVTNSLSFGTGRDFTIEFWVNPLRNGNDNTVLMQKYTGSDWRISQTTSNTLSLTSYPGGGWATVYATTPLVTGVWTHVALTFNRTSSATEDYVNIFHNGVLVDELEPGWKFPTGADQPVYLLGRSDGHGTATYHGYMDEVRISDTIRYIPEPNTIALLALSGSALLFLRKRKRTL